MAWPPCGVLLTHPPPRPPFGLADGAESRRPVAHECLGEALRTLRQIFGYYPLLKTLETLTAAGTLISRVKGQ